MNKTFLLLLHLAAAGNAMAASPVADTSANTMAERILGDVNGDGKVTMADVNMVLNQRIDIYGEGNTSQKNAQAVMAAFLTGKAVYEPRYEGKSPYIAKVNEYVPAPGQFVNTMPQYEEGDDAERMAEKCTEALANDARVAVSLGGFGGYVTFHFDHSVRNIEGKRDILILGNSHSDSSEPGIVMVSQDLNGNGLPDDEWYELSGSADVDSIGKVTYGYEVTYTYAPMQNIPWTDSMGEHGVVERNTFHKQEYFPLWLVKDDNTTLIFKGTCLPKNAINTSTGKPEKWVFDHLRYGYVDNWPNMKNGEKDIESNGFDISWAVHPITREPVKLGWVDFVRVYCATNQQCGWLGETSTEVMGAEDLNF